MRGPNRKKNENSENNFEIKNEEKKKNQKGIRSSPFQYREFQHMKFLYPAEQKGENKT